MADAPDKKVLARKLLFAALCESVAIIAGLIAWAVTGSWVWILIGVIFGTGFTLPAIIEFVRAWAGERK